MLFISTGSSDGVLDQQATWQRRKLQYLKLREILISFSNTKFISSSACTLLQEAIVVAFDLHLIDENLKMLNRQYNLDQIQKNHIKGIISQYNFLLNLCITLFAFN